MTDRPIIFGAGMVLALLDGRKTMTRRLVYGKASGKDWPRPSVWTKVRPSDRLWVKTTRFGKRVDSTITLIVTATRIERLQEITEADAKAEGVVAVKAGIGPDDEPLKTFRTGFVYLWTSLHGPGSWSANPEVVAITFCVVQANIDKEPPA